MIVKRKSPKPEEPAKPPLIMAPAGNRDSFLAAVAAGADAIYCGLKQFSARMEAKNFNLDELASLTRLAHDRGVKVYVTVNNLLKPDELNEAGALIERLGQWVRPDALILQDLAVVNLARQAGFSGELHLSTLANMSHPAGLKFIREHLGVTRVVLPRELNIDEIKALNEQCPPGLDLEVFIHGALCFGVSGRCYWSSFLGGKSGLRGRCVQPCRRIYEQQGRTGKHFSCRDLSLDVLVKVLLPLPRIRAWKIEGRKKGPHYVYHVVRAYRLLRDAAAGTAEAEWASVKKEALELLSFSLGRETTHHLFLPQRPQMATGGPGETGSGYFLGRIGAGDGKPSLSPRIDLFPGDMLRVGYEGESAHALVRVPISVPRRGRLVLQVPGKGWAKGTPVFLTDRRDKELAEWIAGLEKSLVPMPEPGRAGEPFRAELPRKTRKKALAVEMNVYRTAGRESLRGSGGLWLSDETAGTVRRGYASGIWWWLSPVVWPEEEARVRERIEAVLAKGARQFVLNAPWQISLFGKPEGLTLWAGPFCNPSNPLALQMLASVGFSGALASPELGQGDYRDLAANSPLPLGIVISGMWPLCVSRSLPEEIRLRAPFSSPKGEEAWADRFESLYWIFPGWQLDLEEKKGELQQLGFSLFVRLKESIPAGVRLKKRPGLWSWELKLL